MTCNWSKGWWRQTHWIIKSPYRRVQFLCLMVRAFTRRKWSMGTYHVPKQPLTLLRFGKLVRFLWKWRRGLNSISNESTTSKNQGISTWICHRIDYFVIVHHNHIPLFPWPIRSSWIPCCANIRIWIPHMTFRVCAQTEWWRTGGFFFSTNRTKIRSMKNSLYDSVDVDSEWMVGRESGVFKFFSHVLTQEFAKLHLQAFEKNDQWHEWRFDGQFLHTLASASGEVFMNLQRPVSETCSRLGQNEKGDRRMSNWNILWYVVDSTTQCQCCRKLHSCIPSSKVIGIFRSFIRSLWKSEANILRSRDRRWEFCCSWHGFRTGEDKRWSWGNTLEYQTAKHESKAKLY